MSKISVIATLTAAEGKVDELTSGLEAVIKAADEEAGLEIYSLHKDTEDPNTLYFFELYTDDEAVAVHGKGEQMRAAMGALAGLLAGRPDVKHLAPVVAKGLDL